MSKEELQKLGQNGKSFQQANFDLEKSIDHLEEILE